MRVFLLSAVAAFLVLPSSVAAQQQESPKPEKYENVTWYAVVDIDFRSGKRDAALDIIRDHFAPAGRESGSPGPVMQLEHQSGEWDLTVIWHMKEGPSGMEWKTTAEGIAWQQKFAELSGGEDRAKEIGETFESYIARENVTITRQDEDLMAITQR